VEEREGAAVSIRPSKEPTDYGPLPPGFPEAWRSRELKMLKIRREAVDLGGKRAHERQVGFAVSGGGIRSATLALGIFQALAKAELVRHIDYLSTVSGGGYFGSFLGALFFRADQLSGVKEPPSDGGVGPASRHRDRTVSLVERILEDNDHPVLRFLRRNGQYLAPAGNSDKMLLGAVLLRNWLSISLLVWATLLLIALGFETLWLLIRTLVETCALTANSEVVKELMWLPSESNVSPWLFGAAFIITFGAGTLGWSYWLVDKDAPVRRSLVALVGATGISALLFSDPNLEAWVSGLPIVLWALSALWSSFARAGLDTSSEEAKINSDAKARHRVSVWLKTSLVYAMGALYIAICDSLGRVAYSVLSEALWTATTLALVTTGLAQEMWRRAPSIGQFFARKGGQSRPKMSLGVVTGLTAAVLLTGMLTVGFLFAQLLARGGIPSRPGQELDEVLLYSAIALGAVAFAALLGGTTRTLLNRSSHLPIYGARLTRAFLGASNPARHGDSPKPNGSEVNGPDPGAATCLIPGDDLSAAQYFGWVRAPNAGLYNQGGPLHLINVTVNETVDRRTQTHEEDRRGIGMAVGPSGFSLGVRHHLAVESGTARADKSLPDEVAGGFRVFEKPLVGAAEVAEKLTLGQWAGISGAAFSTGLGSRTRASFSFLAGLFNVRLGYWWRAPAQKAEKGPRPMFRSLFWVQRYLFGEFSARFPGTANPLWYLSDGGHFENMGAYELIRRELPIIVVLDGEADPNYEFEGLGNLVRKARIDFGAEIEFLGEPTLLLGERTPPGLGSLSQLKPSRTGNARAQAALALIRYERTGRTGQLLYVKANRFEGLPVDLRNYAAEHGEFPQETTGDQFFDEAQWESYRKLGAIIGERLFGGSSRLADWLRGDPEALSAFLQPE
jgi:hypothetical protein